MVGVGSWLGVGDGLVSTTGVFVGLEYWSGLVVGVGSCSGVFVGVGSWLGVFVGFTGGVFTGLLFTGVLLGSWVPDGEGVLVLQRPLVERLLRAILLEGTDMSRAATWGTGANSG